jgi:hypothetical protein
MIHFNKKNVSAGFTGNVQLLSMAGSTSRNISPTWIAVYGTGNYLIAVSYPPNSRNYLSTDSGATWSRMTNTPTSEGSTNFRQASISRDGKFRLYTVNALNASQIFSTSNNGTNYTTSSDRLTLQGAFVSDDGNVKLASSNNNSSYSNSGYIYRIINEPNKNTFANDFVGGGRMARGSIRGSSNGQYVMNQSGSNGMQFSANYGDTWSSLAGVTGLTGSAVDNMGDMAISGDGKYMIISGTGYKLWLSTNYGSNWTTITGMGGLPNTSTYISTTNPWGGCTISKDGQYMSVVGYFTDTGTTFQNKAYVFISSNFGVSWNPKEIPLTNTSNIGFLGTMSYNDTGIPIRIFISTYSNGIYYIDF